MMLRSSEHEVEVLDHGRVTLDLRPHTYVHSQVLKRSLWANTGVKYWGKLHQSRFEILDYRDFCFCIKFYFQNWSRNVNCSVDIICPQHCWCCHVKEIGTY